MLPDDLVGDNSMNRISRRTLALGTVWATPVALAVASAPRVSASPLCADTTLTLDWRRGIYATTIQTVGAVTEIIAFSFIPDVWPELTITGSTTRYGTSHGSGPNFLRTDTIGGFYSSGLTLNYNEWTTTGYVNRTDWTIGFSQSVTGLSFAITDIDWDGPNPNQGNVVSNRENVAISPAPGSTTLGSAMAGSGTVADPWISVNNFVDNDNTTSSIANVGVDYGSIPVTAFTVAGWSTAINAGTQENIFLSTMTIDCPLG